jgi:hypothetical protein
MANTFAGAAFRYRRGASDCRFSRQSNHGGHHMRFGSKSLVLKAAIVAVMVCVGATAIHAWQVQTNKGEKKPVLVQGGMSRFILDLHNSAHLDNLPVQQIDDYN